MFGRRRRRLKTVDPVLFLTRTPDGFPPGRLAPHPDGGLAAVTDVSPSHLALDADAAGRTGDPTILYEVRGRPA